MQIHRHEAAYDEVFREQLGKIVYLTADSEMTLERLEPDEVYIIGGIVDRNRFANMCLDQAAAKVRSPSGQRCVGGCCWMVWSLRAIMSTWRVRSLISCSSVK